MFISDIKNKNNKMGPANKNKSESGSSWRSDEEEKIQAIIIADSFNRKFTPVTQETPRVRTTLS